MMRSCDGRHDRATRCRRQDVVGAEHEDAGLGLGLGRQRHVDGHLVAVEVGVERRADERMDLQCLALDEHRLEGLDAEAVQRRCTVEEHRMLLDDVFEDVPHLRAATLDHALGGLDVLRQLEVDETLHDERLEQLERHQLRQTTLVQAQRRAGHDDRTARVVDALAEQVLTEAALLALEHVGQRLERAVARPGDRAATATVVEQCVDGLLQHALFVVDDDLRRAEVEQTLESVVAVDHAAVEVVEVRRGEAATVELDHRAQLRRDHRHDVEDHGLRVVGAATVLVATVERRDDLEALDGLLLALGAERLLAFLRVDRVAELDLLLVEIDAVDERLDRLGAGAAFEVLAVLVAHLAPQHLVFDDLAGVEALELVPGASDEVEFDLVALADAFDFLVGFLLDLLQVGGLGVFLLCLGRGLLELLEAAIDGEFHLLHDRVALFEVLGFEVREVLVAALFVDPAHEMGGEVDDLLEHLGLELFLRLDAGEEVGEPRPGAAEVPDVHGRGGQLDVAHAVATDLRAGDLDATALADDALEPDALVLAAVALPVTCRPEDLLAEQAVLLGAQRAVVDRLGLLHLTVRPGADLIRRGQADLQLVEHVDVEHVGSPSSLRVFGASFGWRYLRGQTPDVTSVAVESCPQMVVTSGV